MDDQNTNGYTYNGQPYNSQPYNGQPYPGQQAYTTQGQAPVSNTVPDQAQNTAAQSSAPDQMPNQGVQPDVTYHASYTQPQASAQPQAAPPVPPTPPQEPRKQKRPKGERRRLGIGGIVALCLVCVIVAGLAGAAIMYFTTGQNDASVSDSVEEAVVATATPAPVVTSNSSDGAVNENAAYIYELATQQVVGVTTEITYTNVFGQYTAAVAGSGIIITEDGYILTNYHVIEDAYEGGYQVEVLMYDETEYDAEIVGFDEDNDLALLKIDATGLNAAELGDSDDLTVGQIVYAVGNPLGELSYTMTSGIVSATDRTITTESDVAVNMFQIDAAVNSGNSGGPVYNTAGQVIGIVTAKYSSTGVEGLGFAIPISDAVGIINDLMNYGYVTGKASLGVTVNTVTSSVAQYYNMVQGAYVYSVTADSAAETAGIQAGDIITALDDTEITSNSDLTIAIKSYHAGDTAEITVWRNQQYLTLTVTFDEKGPDTTEETTTTTTEDPYSDYYSGGIEDFFQEFFGRGN